MKITFFTVILLIVFSLSVKASLAQTTDSSGSADIRNAIRQEVQKRLSQASTTKTTGQVLVGSVITIQATGSQLQITTARQGDKIASFSAQTKIIRITPSESKIVKANNIAVGDSIISIGQTNAENVQLSKRIILYTQESQKRFVYLGNITKIDTKSLVLKPAKSEEKIELALSKTVLKKIDKNDKAVALSISGLKVGDLVLVAGTSLEGKLSTADLLIQLSTPSPQANTKI